MHKTRLKVALSVWAFTFGVLPFSMICASSILSENTLRGQAPTSSSKTVDSSENQFIDDVNSATGTAMAHSEISEFKGSSTTQSSTDTNTLRNAEDEVAYASDEALVPAVESDLNEQYSQPFNSFQNVQNSVSNQQILKAMDDSLTSDAQEMSIDDDDLWRQDQSNKDDQASKSDMSTRLSSSEKMNQKGSALIDKFVDAYQGYAPSVVAGIGGMAVTAAANTAAPGVGTVAGMASAPLLKMGAGIATKVTGEIIRAGGKGVLSLGTSGATLISKTAKSAIDQSAPSSIQNNAKRVKTKVDHAMALAKSVLGNLTGGIFGDKRK